MKKHLAFAFVLTSLFLWVYGYMQIDGLIGYPESVQRSATDVWMLCDAIAKMFVFLALALLTTRYLNILCAFGVGLCANNLYDEMFLNPREMGWPEVVIAILLSIYLIYNVVIMYGKSRRI